MNKTNYAVVLGFILVFAVLIASIYGADYVFKPKGY
jgi:hypothetical protein